MIALFLAAILGCAAATPVARTVRQETAWVFDEVLSATTLFDEAAGTIEIELVGLTGGWVGLGANTNCSMIGADLVIGWVNAAGEGFAVDLIGKPDSNGLPILDESQDVELLESVGTDTETVVRLVKTINPSDPDDLTPNGEPVTIIWAWGTFDPTDDVLASDDYHGGTRGCVQMGF